jgi:hypothetical protein
VGLDGLSSVSTASSAAIQGNQSYSWSIFGRISRFKSVQHSISELFTLFMHITKAIAAATTAKHVGVPNSFNNSELASS